MRIPRTFHLLVLLSSTVLLSLGLMGVTSAQTQGPEVLVADVDGVINNVVERYISRAVDRAVDRDSEVLVIKLNTPGGLLSSTEEIVEDLLSDRVTTAVYVSPRGASAASAGTFITAAGAFAVMAPASNIGAAAPVGVGGEDLPETLKGKVVEHTASLMRAIAAHRGRNSEALVDTIVKDPPRSYTSEEAADLGVVDFVAADIRELLARIDGQTVVVQTDAGPIEKTLDLQGAVLENFSMSFVERFLYFLADPNVSFMLLSLGGLGLVIELFNPGMIVPAVVGAILLLLAFVSLGNLPVNWAAVGFLGLAVGLFIAEMFVSGFGILGIGSIIAFIFGGLLLFDSFGSPSPTAPNIRVNPYLLGSFAGVLTLLGFWFLRTVVQSRRESKQTEDELTHLIGAVGTVTADLDPRGSVRIEERLWTAVSHGGTFIKSGERIVVVEVEGVILTVTRADGGPHQEGP